jgi:glutathione S-transferase
MPITVYGVAMSTCTQRVLTTLVEKGLKYEIKAIDFAAGEHKEKIQIEIVVFLEKRFFLV